MPKNNREGLANPNSLRRENALSLGVKSGLLDSATLDRTRDRTIRPEGDGVLIPALRNINDFVENEAVLFYDPQMSNSMIPGRVIGRIDEIVLIQGPGQSVVQSTDARYFGLWREIDIRILHDVRQRTAGSWGASVGQIITTAQASLAPETDVTILRKTRRIFDERYESILELIEGVDCQNDVPPQTKATVDFILHKVQSDD